MSESLFFLFSILLFGAEIVFPLAVIGFVVSLWRKDNGVADVLYPVHFVAVSVLTGLISYAYASIFDVFPTVSLLLILLVMLWGVRLSLRILRKNRGKPEDFRYAAWRAKWKWFRARSFFQIYVLQAAIALVIVSPAALAILLTPVRLDLVTVFGIAVIVFGILFEALADHQLDRFLRDGRNAGKLMTSGLWRFSRHPNYFGESTVWWGFWVVSVSLAPDIWYVTLVSPALITFLLLRVSGVPMMEAHFAGRPDWEEYAKRTSVFIPLPPKKG